MVEEIVIDNIKYFIDEKGVVYDTDNKETVGVYNREKKEWILLDKFHGGFMKFAT